jgi:hypothetical protein
MNNCIKSISKVYLILLIPLVSLLIINNIVVFAQEQQGQQQQQNVNIASYKDDSSFFSFFEKIKNPNSIVSENVKESPVINKQNGSLNQDIKVLMLANIPELKEIVMDVKESIADGEIEEALIDVTDIQNEFLLLQNKTTFTEDFQKIKDDISNRDFAKALDDITDIQKKIIKIETEIFKAQISNPILTNKTS